MVSGLVRLRIWLGRGFHTTSAAHTPRSCSTLTSCPGKATPSTGPAAVAEAAAASRPIGCALVVYPPCTASVKFGSLTITGTLWSPSDRGAWMALVCSRKAEARRMHEGFATHSAGRTPPVVGEASLTASSAVAFWAQKSSSELSPPAVAAEATPNMNSSRSRFLPLLNE